MLVSELKADLQEAAEILGDCSESQRNSEENVNLKQKLDLGARRKDRTSLMT